jgi:iron-sulfur cluster repair protein YtfE (RIC family)
MKSDPWEMALVHRLIRRAFERGRDYVLAPGAADRADAVGRYIGFSLDGLHAHHSTEDDLIWPALQQRAAPSATMILRMEDQHAGLHDAVLATRSALATWIATPSAAGAQAVAAAIDTLLERLAAHLDDEERDIVPLIAAHINQEEWDEVGQLAFSKFSPEDRFYAMGELLESATPEEAARMMAGVPLPVRILWRLVGHRRYDRFMATVQPAPTA